MSLIIEKLKAAKIPEEIIRILEAKFGTKLIDEIQKNGLKWVAEKAGIDPKNIADIDFGELMEMSEDMAGIRDSDHDGKVGMDEIKDTVGSFVEKSGAIEAFADAKETILESEVTKKASEAAGKLFSKIQGFIK